MKIKLELSVFYYLMCSVNLSGWHTALRLRTLSLGEHFINLQNDCIQIILCQELSHANTKYQLCDLTSHPHIK